MAEQRFDGDVLVTGGLTVIGTFAGNVNRSSLIHEPSKAFHLPLASFRVWDAMQTNLPGTGAVDDLGLNSGVPGSNTPNLRTADLNGGAANGTYYARVVYMLPVEYVAGQTLVIRFRAGMILAVAATSATVDAQAFLLNGDTTVAGIDLVTTTAITINSLTFANCDFTVNPSGLVAGDLLDIRIAVAASSATATSHFAAISSIAMLMTIKG